MTSFDIERRKVLQASGAAVLAGLAGCTGILADGTGVPGKAKPVDESNGENGGSNVPEEVDSRLSEQSANLYEGELADHTGESEVTIAVGGGENGLAFDEPAVRVDPGTTIVWEWTGNGGGHNVIHDADQQAFNSGSAVSEAGFTFETTLDEEGNYVYFCDPHSSLGMWGAIVVGGGGGGNVPSAVDSYLTENGANGYEGSVTDMTGQGSVTVEVGAGSQGLAFSPVAVTVDAGTEVTWEWTGNGGGHNVKINEGPTQFSSETVSEAGHTYSQTLDDPGNYLYQCTPHSALGMHGAVIVQSAGGGEGSDGSDGTDGSDGSDGTDGSDGNETSSGGE
jgi:halocyanin-like protein